jgi:competence protein ComGC
MIKHEHSRNHGGFALMELIAIVIVVLILLALLIWPNMVEVRSRAQRVNCLSNMNEMWKSIVAWELTSGDEFRPWDDETKGMDVVREFPPETFICPEAGRLCKTKPDTNS